MQVKTIANQETGQLSSAVADDLGEMIVSRKGTVQVCNRGIERILRLREREMLGRELNEILRPVDLSKPSFEQWFEQAMEDGVSQFKGAFLRGSRTPFDCHIVIQHLNPQTSPAGGEFSILLRDLSGQEVNYANIEVYTRLDEMARSFPELMTPHEAMAVVLDSTIELLPCDLAGAAVLKQGVSEGALISRLEPIEAIRAFFVEQLQRDLANLLGKEAPPLRLKANLTANPVSVKSSPAGFQSKLSMPVYMAGKVMGIVCIVHRQPDAFTFEHERILSTLATHLSLALQQLYKQESLQSSVSELKKLNLTLARLYGAMEKISFARDEGALLDMVLDLALQEGRGDAGSILLLEDNGTDLRVAASHGLTDAILRSNSHNRADGIARWVIRQGKPLNLGQALDHPEFKSVALAREILHSLVVPLRVQERIIGTLSVNRIRKSEPFPPLDTEAMLLLGNSAAVAVENIRLSQRQIEQERIATIGHTVMNIGHYIKNLNTVLQVGRKMVDQAIAAKNWIALETAWGAIRRSTEKLTHLSMDLLDYSRPKVPVLVEMDVHALLKETVGEVEIPAAHRGVTVEFVPQAQPAIVKIDREQINRCLMNLITNAIDAMPDGGQLILRTRTAKPENAGAKGWLVVEVADTGTGIPPEILPKIFLPLFSTKGSRGTGIGLAVTKKIVEEHGGRIEVETALGKGSVFKLHFPQ